MTFDSPLPPLYAAWMDDLLDAPIPAESNATCESCAMVPESGSDDVGFDAAVKCCTFQPELWNFLAGAVLLDDSADAARGRATLEARIDRGVAVTPLKVGREPSYQARYDESLLAFGHSRALLCPHYLPEDGGRCGVWRHRESTCTTWFCKFVRGAVGQQFWSHLHQLLRAAEESVASWCVLELGLDARALAALHRPPWDTKADALLPPDVAREADAARLAIAWGAWRGRERELYRECATRVATLKWSDVLLLGGAHLAVYARLTREAHARLMSDAVLEHPIAALVQIKPRGAHRVRLTTYSATDELDLPAIIAKVLPYFDGRPKTEALAEIRAREGVNVDVSLVRKLTDFGVLQDAANG